jgi:hypothetical protein
MCPILSKFNKYSVQTILHEYFLRSHIIMACKLVIMKQKRADISTPFYQLTSEQKTALEAQPGAVVVGERNISYGLVKIRTLFFPSLDHYDQWANNSVIQSVIGSRDAYNNAHGIQYVTEVVDLPSFDAY